MKSFITLCTQCYGLLQKLFIFASSCLEWEEQLHSYGDGLKKVSLEYFLQHLKQKDELEIDTVKIEEMETVCVKEEDKCQKCEAVIKDEEEDQEMVYKEETDRNYDK